MDIRGRIVPLETIGTILPTYRVFPAVTWCCQRCGALPVRGACTCKKVCYYCRKCLAYGKLRSCGKLVTDPRRLDPVAPSTHGPLTLTSDQQRVAQVIQRTVLKKGRLLVHAVCGAGKTPMLFPGIAAALANGRRVLVAAPRADVVRELTAHLKRAFTTATIVSLYGGSPERLQIGDITVSTTHQLIHYRDCFDVVFIDEVDAFPYRMDRTLRRFVRRAMTQDAAMILLSATPSFWHRRLPTVRLMRRYHGHPLPVPRQVIPYTSQTVRDWLKQHDGAPRLVFVSRIAELDRWQGILAASGLDVETVHAADPDRIEKVKRFRTSTTILLTTTILERGVTIENVQVMVLDADHGFSAAALIQISGRVGRSTVHPDGDIVFCANDRSDAMYEAVYQIKQANKRRA
ncbi:helicase-related protein [Exiguobacterium sp. TDN 0502]|uniref:helicase-related protein n=1 Tax=Exiguobacterium sp. TDN 0502 TaxID=3420731 RepID=UPI003D771C9F